MYKERKYQQQSFKEGLFCKKKIFLRTITHSLG